MGSGGRVAAELQQRSCEQVNVITYLYWRHTQTQEIFAVRVNNAGVLDGAVGPIPPNQATAVKLGQWAFDLKKGEQLRRRFLEFERFKP